jgi:hypothetical protein
VSLYSLLKELFLLFINYPINTKNKCIELFNFLVVNLNYPNKPKQM